MSARLRVSRVQAYGASLLVWTAQVLVHSLASYTDQVRRGRDASLSGTIAEVMPAYVPWVFFSAILLRVLVSHADALTRIPVVARLLGSAFVLFMIPQSAYQVALTMGVSGKPWSEFGHRFLTWPALFWLTDTGLFVLVFVSVYAFVVLRENTLALESRQRAEAENMALKLEIEQHRLRALRGQLEPHFMFNALNAISGLVRGDDKAVALSALSQLSALLRYALTASSRDWVTLGDELAFVLDYVTLQRLRFGNRLHFAAPEPDDRTRSADCPPLLLQPLIENAIRHDLECHEEPSDIRLSIETRGERLIVEVTNSTRPEAAPNPGVGLGLMGTRDRLSILYGKDAECVTSSGNGRFTVRLSLPAARPDSVPS
jgi:hypothetical protein